MKKIRYYIETSVFSFVFAEDDLKRRDLTKKFLDSLQQESAEIYISAVLIDEINEAPEQLKKKLLELIEKYQPILLSIDNETKELADKYVGEKIIPRKYIEDAYHLAVASVNDIDVIVSWNFQHIVKLKTKIEVNGVNKLLGYHEIEICSPEEVIGYD